MRRLRNSSKFSHQSANKSAARRHEGYDAANRTPIGSAARPSALPVWSRSLCAYRSLPLPSRRASAGQHKTKWTVNTSRTRAPSRCLKVTVRIPRCASAVVKEVGVLRLVRVLASEDTHSLRMTSGLGGLRHGQSRVCPTSCHHAPLRNKHEKGRRPHRARRR